jgi:glycosyltransferase involved in cell wall biosynthesis
MKSKIDSVSVVMSTAHEPLDIVRQAVESILLQTLLPDEFIIIVDDASNTEVFEYLQKLADETPLLKVFLHQEQQGLAVCRNEGIHQSTSDYVALMDADDISLPKRVETQLKFIQAENLDAVFSHVAYIDSDGSKLGTFTPHTTEPKQDIFRRHIFAHPTGFFKRTVFKLAVYDESFTRAQDVDLWIRLLAAGARFGIVPIVLLQYRIHTKENPAQRIKRQAAYAKYGFKIVKKHVASYWNQPYFWYFAARWAWWRSFYVFAPQLLLVTLVRVKDRFKN